MAEQRRDKVARAVDHTSTAVAGTIGSALGAAKLRDKYKEEHATKYAAHAAKVEEAAHGVAPKVGRLTRVVSHGEPNFAMLATGAAAGGVAGAASAYRDHRKKLLAKADWGADLEGLDFRYVKWRGKKLRVLGRHSDTHIKVLDHGDMERPVPLSQVTPIRKDLTFTQVEATARKKADRGQGFLRATDVVDDSMRRARKKLVPSQAKIAVQVVDDTKQQIQKDYDPDLRRKRAYQAGAAGAGVGAVVGGRSAVGEARNAHGEWTKSQASFERSERSFSAARDWEKQLDAQRKGMLRPVGTPGNVGGSMRARIAEMDSMENARRLRHQEGMGAYRAGQREAVAAGKSLKRVRNKTAGALALGTAAVVSRQRAHQRDYR